MSKYRFNFKTYHGDELLDDTSVNKQPMELVQGKKFLIPEFETQLTKNTENKFECSTTVITEDYVKLSSVLRNREMGKPTKAQHKCAVTAMHDHHSGFCDLDKLPKPKVELRFEFFDVEKLEDGSYEKDVWMLKNKTEKLEFVQKLHVQGNSDFKQGKYEDAVVSYEKIIQIYGGILSELFPDAENPESEFRMIKEKETVIVLNLCQCLIQLKKDYGKVVDYCSKIIDSKIVKCDNPKVFYRRAFAHIELMNKKEALLDLDEVVKLDQSIPTKKSCEKLKEKMLKYEKERDGCLKNRLKNAFMV